MSFFLGTRLWLSWMCSACSLNFIESGVTTGLLCQGCESYRLHRLRGVAGEVHRSLSWVVTFLALGRFQAGAGSSLSYEAFPTCGWEPSFSWSTWHQHAGTDPNRGNPGGPVLWKSRRKLSFGEADGFGGFGDLPGEGIGSGSRIGSKFSSGDGHVQLYGLVTDSPGIGVKYNSASGGSLPRSPGRKPRSTGGWSSAGRGG